MNTIEERLWNYIDGNCSEEERKAIDLLIANDEAYRSKFEELLSFDKEFAAIEPDEPSMGFTYKVMEGIRTGYAQQPLKAAINKQIIRVIGGFFIISILLLTVFVLSNLHLSPVKLSVHLPDSVKLPEIKNYMNSTVLQWFFCFDIVLGLFLFDGWLRRRKVSKQV